jgi:putative transposase
MREMQRNGCRARAWETRAGRIGLAIPKLRKGSCFPSFLEPRRTAEKALVAVIQKARVHGISTRAVDDPVRAMGGGGMSKSQVSRLCAHIDVRVNAFLNRQLEGTWACLWLDATYIKVRDRGRIVRRAVTVAVAVNDGEREVLGVGTGPSEAETFWTDFLRSLADGGLRGVRRVVADDHKGLRAAARRVFDTTISAAACTRNALAHEPTKQRAAVAAMLKTIFAQETRAEAVAQWVVVRRQLLPHLSELGADGRHGLTLRGRTEVTLNRPRPSGGRPRTCWRVTRTFPAMSNPGPTIRWGRGRRTSAGPTAASTAPTTCARHSSNGCIGLFNEHIAEVSRAPASTSRSS